ncbi:hypothetical protein [Pantoea agglomerans]|uniref:hypothetical protein n=1 Tax=Enterobacter agglomerans TaxID=549 RepID=UPI0013B88B87|nr:hypothetical protein [Pantoea agglomerans]NEG58229.1 hypothetical protein [Pantoea agglomerans]NEG99942.1 hypothetical protein [Pantoea agglomerans]NEH04095.1 hypothetical protein [Pantoea agglomerans]NEH14502.1 hypothetical protein [Pantoea agglomerans]
MAKDKDDVGKQTQIASLYAAVIFLACVLLLTKMIDGASFVALLVAGAIGVSVYALLPKISEFSIGGNTVKFQEKLHEAEKITKELNVIKQIAIRNTLNTISIKKEYNLLVYESIKEFKNIYDIIKGNNDDLVFFQDDLVRAALTLRENVCDFIGKGNIKLDRKRLESIKLKIKLFESIPNGSSEKMEYHFCKLYLILSDFIDGILAGNTPELVLLDSGVAWFVIKKERTWDD